MNLVILDAGTLGNDIDLSPFNNFGNVTVYQSTPDEKIIERIKNSEIVILNKVVIGEDKFKQLPNLKIICLTATGYNNINIDSAKKHGVVVANVPNYSTKSVVQHTIGMLLYQIQHLNYYDNYIKSGKYKDSPIFTHIERPWNEINGKNWGIIGLGNIGRGVAEVATVLGANVSYFSTSGIKREESYPSVSLDNLLKTSDIISIHAPLNNVTIDLISFNEFNQCKKNLIILNLGRGGIINEAALAKAIDDNQISGACIDVLTKEPVAKDNPLIHIKNTDKLFITPHIAWASIEARQKLISEICHNITAFNNSENRNRV